MANHPCGGVLSLLSGGFQRASAGWYDPASNEQNLCNYPPSGRIPETTPNRPCLAMSVGGFDVSGLCFIRTCLLPQCPELASSWPGQGLLSTCLSFEPSAGKRRHLWCGRDAGLGVFAHDVDGPERGAQDVFAVGGGWLVPALVSIEKGHAILQ